MDFFIKSGQGLPAFIFCGAMFCNGAAASGQGQSALFFHYTAGDRVLAQVEPGSSGTRVSPLPKRISVHSGQQIFVEIDEAEPFRDYSVNGRRIPRDTILPLHELSAKLKVRSKEFADQYPEASQLCDVQASFAELSKLQDDYKSYAETRFFPANICHLEKALDKANPKTVSDQLQPHLAMWRTEFTDKVKHGTAGPVEGRRLDELLAATEAYERAYGTAYDELKLQLKLVHDSSHLSFRTEAGQRRKLVIVEETANSVYDPNRLLRLMPPRTIYNLFGALY